MVLARAAFVPLILLGFATAEKVCTEQQAKSDASEPPKLARGKGLLQITSHGNSSGVDAYEGGSDICACDPLSKYLKAGTYSLMSVKATRDFDPFPCPLPDPMQLIKDSGVASVYKLDIGTGNYLPLFSVTPPAAITNWQWGEINAVGLSIVDNFAYAVMKRKDGTSSYLVRFGPPKQGAASTAVEVELLGEIPGINYYSATVDLNGAWVGWSNDKALCIIPGLATITAVAVGDPAPDLSAAPGAQCLLEPLAIPSTPGAADLVPFTAKVQGADHNFIMGVTGSRGAWTFDLTPGVQTPFAEYSTDALGGDGYGAGWYYKGRVYFSNNGGNGVFEFDYKNIDVSKTPAHMPAIRVLNSSQPTTANDGFNCADADEPFTPNPSPTPPPPPPAIPGCELFCWANGCECLIPETERCKVKSCSNCAYCAAR